MIKNISCKQCDFFAYCKEYENANRKHVDKHGVWQKVFSPIRKCQHAIAQKWFTPLHDVSVLEVGCGSSRKGSFIRELLNKNKCKWTGIDISPTDQTSVVCNIDDMPFKEMEFDVIIGNQTMEHWTDVPKALTEIYRVLKHEGLLFLNVPIHLHGGDVFFKGDINTALEWFKKANYRNIIVELWRKDYDGLGPYLPMSSVKSLNAIKSKAVSAYIANFVASR